METISDKFFYFKCSKCGIEKSIRLKNEEEAKSIDKHGHENCGGIISYTGKFEEEKDYELKIIEDDKQIEKNRKTEIDVDTKGITEGTKEKEIAEGTKEKGIVADTKKIVEDNKKDDWKIEPEKKFHIKEELSSKIEDRANSEYFLLKISDLVSEIRNMFVKYYYIKDSDIIDVLYAIAYSHILPDDPTWLVIIAQSSGIKTELLRAFGESPSKYIHPSSKITEQALMSGAKIDGEKTLAKKLDGKLWIVKDMTTLLESRPEKIASITSQMRELYDGYISVDSGMEDGSKHVKSKTTLIAGVTPVIDNTRLFKSNMGERVLYKRIPPIDDDGKIQLKDILQRDAFDNYKKRKALYDKTQEFLEIINAYKNHMQEKHGGIRVEIKDQKTYDLIYKLACFVAELRVTAAWGYKGDEIEDISVEESPARLHQELFKLAYSLKMINANEKTNERILRSTVKVALDTIPYKRVLALNLLIKNCPENKPVLNSEIIRFLGNNKISLTTARRPLEELKTMLILESHNAKVEDGKIIEEIKTDLINENYPKIWKFNEKFFKKYIDVLEWFKKVMV